MMQASLTDNIIVLGSVLGAIVTIVKVGKPIAQKLLEKKAKSKMREEQITLMLSQHKEMLEAIKVVTEQVQLNGGSSMKDALVRIEANQAFSREVNRRIISYIESGESPIGTFETDNLGRCIFASDGYLDFCNMTFDEVKGEGWKNTIHQEDLNDVIHYWNESVRAGIDFKRNFKTVDNKHIHCHAKVIKNYKGNVIGYHGTWFKLIN